MNDALLIPVSVGNIRAWIEAGLRSVKGIDDKHDVLKITIPYSGFNDDNNEHVVGVEVELIEHSNKRGVELIRNEP